MAKIHLGRSIKKWKNNKREGSLVKKQEAWRDRNVDGYIMSAENISMLRMPILSILHDISSLGHLSTDLYCCVYVVKTKSDRQQGKQANLLSKSRNSTVLHFKYEIPS